MKDNLKIVFVGHVDHGKSTLIGRILIDTNSLPEGKLEEIRKICAELHREMEIAFLMDFLEEERNQNITIDTSQIFFSSGKRNYVIIDAPGHREFTKNMITGACQADAAVLLVDADEGIMEQTKRHAYILSMLGIRQVVVVLNKMDKVGFSEDTFKTISNDVQDFLKGLRIFSQAIIPISAKFGDNVIQKSSNMDWYKGKSLIEVLEEFTCTKYDDSASLRLPVQDIYIVDEKRIIVGRVESGTIRQDDKIMVLPSGESTQILAIEEFLKEKMEASKGESTGIRIKDKLFVERGNVICSTNDLPIVAKKLNANIFWMSKNPLKINDKFLVRCATQESSAVLTEIKKVINSSTFEANEKCSEISNMDAAEVTIECNTELIIDNFNKVPELGRFVIEIDFDTVGGGIITEK